MFDTRIGSSHGVMALSSLKGVGPTTIEKLVGKFATFDEVFSAGDADFKGVANVTVAGLLRDREAVSKALDDAGSAIASAVDGGISIYCAFEGDYPLRARDVDPLPHLIFVAGDLSICDRSVACVGTRRPSQFGAAVTRRITGRLAEAGWNIVSGLANGVDAISHRTAMTSGVKTAAVVACGLDAFSDDKSLGFANEILEAGGCIVSEQPFGRAEDSGTLVRRNRLQTSLSVGTFVMQCMIESGTMHSVRYAVSQGRPVFAPVPTGEYAKEPESEGVLAITSITGPHLAQRIGVKDSVRDRFEREFPDRPAVFGFRSKDDYDVVLARLEGKYKDLSPEPEQNPSLRS